MKHARFDTAPAPIHDAIKHGHAANTDATPVKAPGVRAWRTWLGVIAGGVLALLALAQGFVTDVSAATLITDSIAVPDNTALAPSSEIIQALPFL